MRLAKDELEGVYHEFLKVADRHDVVNETLLKENIEQRHFESRIILKNPLIRMKKEIPHRRLLAKTTPKPKKEAKATKPAAINSRFFLPSSQCRGSKSHYLLAFGGEI